MRLKYLIAVVLTAVFLNAPAWAGPEESKLSLPAKGSTVRVGLYPQTIKPDTTETTIYAGRLLEGGEKEIKLSATAVLTYVVHEHPFANKVPSGARLLRNVGIGMKPLARAVEVTIPTSNIRSLIFIASDQYFGCSLPNLERHYRGLCGPPASLKSTP
jgi:hypothetical protein